jgi:putative addiction module CopG family antidote
MQIELSKEADEFIRRAVETGRHRRAEDAVREALDLWVERERRREELLAELDVAEAELARGEGIEITKESMRQLAKDVHERGMARMAAKQPKPS